MSQAQGGGLSIGGGLPVSGEPTLGQVARFLGAGGGVQRTEGACATAGFERPMNLAVTSQTDLDFKKNRTFAHDAAKVPSELILLKNSLVLVRHGKLSL